METDCLKSGTPNPSEAGGKWGAEEKKGFRIFVCFVRIRLDKRGSLDGCFGCITRIRMDGKWIWIFACSMEMRLDE